MSPAPKFELPIAQEGTVYKIVQNKYKIMMYFSFSKSVLGGGGDMYLSSILQVEGILTSEISLDYHKI